MRNPYQSESKTLAEIWERGRQDRANGAAWESRPKYTSFTAMIAYMQGWGA